MLTLVYKRVLLHSSRDVSEPVLVGKFLHLDKPYPPDVAGSARRQSNLTMVTFLRKLEEGEPFLRLLKGFPPPGKTTKSSVKQI